jgi:LPS O-antigen subunit length determinant protein (WzzB/FepE family)
MILSKKKYKELMERLNKAEDDAIRFNMKSIRTQEDLDKALKENKILVTEKSVLEEELEREKDRYKKYVNKEAKETIAAKKKWLNGYPGEEYGGK